MYEVNPALFQTIQKVWQLICRTVGSQKKKRGRQDGRRVSLAYIIKLLENADTLGIQLVIDYALNRSWKCDRGTWIAGTFESGDWFHIEVDPVICNSLELAKQAWDKVFGVIPAVVKKPV